MPYRAKILSAMFALAEPGYSQYSRVEVPAPEPCLVESCTSTVETLTGHKPRLDFKHVSMRGEWPGWSRPESRAEGLHRFATIAVAADYVEQHPPKTWRSSVGPFPTGELWEGLVTIMRHESAFWRSVHEGRIRGAAGEWCLMQIHPSVLPSLNVEGPELVGVDFDSTVRCLMAGAELLGRARRLCPPTAEGWFPPTIAAYGSGQGCHITDDWVDARVKTYGSVQRPRRTPGGALLALYFASDGLDGWTPAPFEPDPLPLPNVNVVEVRVTHDELEECTPSLAQVPCLQRLPYSAVTREMSALAVNVFKAHRRDPHGTEVHLSHQGTLFVAKIEVHSDWRRGDHKGLTLFELVREDWCGSGGENTCQ